MDERAVFVGESRGLEAGSKTLSLAEAAVRLATSHRQVLQSGWRPIITERCKMAESAFVLKN